MKFICVGPTFTCAEARNAMRCELCLDLIATPPVFTFPKMLPLRASLRNFKDARQWWIVKVL